MKRVKYSLKTSDKKTAKVNASHLNSNFINLLYNLDNILINNNNYRLKTFKNGDRTMMEMILKGVNYANKTIDSIELNPDRLDEDLTLFKSFEKGFVQIVTSNQPSNNDDEITVAKLIEIYSDEKVSTGQWPEKRRNEIGAIYTLFTRIHSKDLAANSITNKMAGSFKEILLKLPPNINGIANRKYYEGKTLKEIIALGHQPMSVTNANKYLNNLSYLFQWGEDHGHLTKNPFKRLKINSKGKKKKVSKERARFTDDDLININSLIYSKKSLKPYMYWIPLILLHTGARIKEVAQLYVKDIYQINDIWVFSINENESDQLLKNVNSERIVPIHPKLIELGILEYLTLLQTNNELRLFPEIKHRREGYGTTPSVWFAKIRKTLGMTKLTPKMDAHSYRHTFIDHLKQQGQDEALVAALVGHLSGGLSFTRYGKDYESNTLVQLMSNVNFNNALVNVPRFSNINISH